MSWLNFNRTIRMGACAFILMGATQAILAQIKSQDTNSTAPISRENLIIPGKSVGMVRKGMTTNDVEAMLGSPTRWVGRIMVYDDRFGMSVGQGKGGVLVIFCGDSSLKGPGVKRFKGRTKEGIGMESTREEVLRAFGPPSTAKPWNHGQEQMEYTTLGLSFILEAGKVINIEVDFRTSGATSPTPPKL